MKSLFNLFIVLGILGAGAVVAADRSHNVEVLVNGERYYCSTNPGPGGGNDYFCRCSSGDNKLFRVDPEGRETELFDYDDPGKCAEGARLHPACTSNKPYYCTCTSGDNKLIRIFPNGNKVELVDYDDPAKCAQGLYENPACR